MNIHSNLEIISTRLEKICKFSSASGSHGLYSHSLEKKRIEYLQEILSLEEEIDHIIYNKQEIRYVLFLIKQKLEECRILILEKRVSK